MRVLLFLLVCFSFSWSQDVTVSFEDLPVDLQAKYKVEQVAVEAVRVKESTTSVMQNAKNIGESVGSAISAGLGAVSSEVNEFADTKVGLFTAIIIGWKVLGDDISGLAGSILYTVVTIPIFITLLSIWIWSYRNVCMGKRYIDTETTEDGGKKIKTYKYKDNTTTSDNDMALLMHGLAIIIGFAAFIASTWNAFF